MVPLEASTFFDHDSDTSLRYEIELKTDLNFGEQMTLEQTLKNILKYCPPNCCLRVEVAKVREEFGINLEFIGFKTDSVNNVETFVLGQTFEDLLTDLEHEALLQVSPSNTWQDSSREMAV